MRTWKTLTFVGTFVACGAVSIAAHATAAHDSSPGPVSGWTQVRYNTCRTTSQWRQWATERCQKNKKEKVLKDLIPFHGSECSGGFAGTAAGWTGIDYRCEVR
ncbi:MAG: hypothetical protein JNL38_25870 [Myxococcales bacterium]|nr:hypothetical protein [Myxococcales bacterium]